MKKQVQDIFKIIPSAYWAMLRVNVLLAFANLALDFISIVLLVPVFIGLFNPDLVLPHSNAAISALLTYSRHHQIQLLFAVLLFFIVKNFVSVKITRFQSGYYYRLSNTLSVNLLRNYFGKALLEVKSEKNSALVKDIIFVPNNFVVYVLSSAIQLASEALLLVSILVAALFINPLATLVLSAMAAIIIAVPYFYDRGKLHSINQAFTEKYNANFNHLLNAINGYAEIKTNQIEAYFLQQFNHSNSALNDMHSKLNADRLAKPRYTETFLVAIISALFVFSRYFSTDYNFNVLFISFLFAASIKIIPSVNRILIGLTNLKSNLYTVPILLKSNTSEAENAVAEEAIAFHEKIELKNINFQFAGSRPLLKDLSLTIRKGEIIGIYGDSGNGKSTLANMITTLIVPDSGQIYCDNNPVTQATRKSYLNRIAYVPQAPFILEGTILENLLLDDSSIKPEILDGYLEAFGLQGLVDSLPKKRHTFIGSNGHALSGGQLQRLAMIRALVKNPEILLLDEATNQLDGNLRNTVAGVLKTISQKQHLTIIAISHNKEELDGFCERVFELKDSALTAIK